MFKNQKVLVTGGGGMIGRSLVRFLLEKGAQITIADLTVPSDLPEDVEFIKVDLR
jgi:nucleoside-diphosphate-sugar epimerase